MIDIFALADLQSDCAADAVFVGALRCVTCCYIVDGRVVGVHVNVHAPGGCCTGYRFGRYRRLAIERC